jgi:murein DD-endopeptidase MepM/ murein hydrolase activator NlpD
MHAALTLALVIAGPAMQARVSVEGSIEGSLAKAIGKDASALAAQVARLVRWRGDIVKNVHKGDELWVLYENALGPELVAMTFTGKELQLSAYRHADARGLPRFYDPDGRLLEPGITNPPVIAYTQITETVQRGRGKRKHQGLDLKAAPGTKVIMPFAGKVSRVNWSRRVNGNCVEVVYEDGHVARFLHLLKIGDAILAGQSLAAGAEIGEVGSTGRSSAPHLHYEIRTPAGEVVDPLTLHGTTVVQLGETELPSFAAAQKLYLQLRSDGKGGL